MKIKDILEAHTDSDIQQKDPQSAGSRGLKFVNKKIKDSKKLVLPQSKNKVDNKQFTCYNKHVITQGEDMSRVFNPDEKAKLTKLIDEGIQVKQEITDLNAGLKDTVKALSEELEIKPAMLNKAISVAFKAGLHEEQAKLEELETILATVGKTQ